MTKYGILFCFIMLCGLTGLYGQLGGMPGGLQDELPADDEIKAAVNDPKIRSAMRAKAQESNVVITQFTPIKYRKQIVAGTNYFVKIRTGNGRRSYVHARIFQSLPHEGSTYSLDGLEVSRGLRDPIDHVKQFGEKY